MVHSYPPPITATVPLSEASGVPAEPSVDWKGDSTAQQGLSLKREPASGIDGADFRFTTAGGNLYAFGLECPATEAGIQSLSVAKAKVKRVTLLGATMHPLRFRQTSAALFVTLPPDTSGGLTYALRIEGAMPIG